MKAINYEKILYQIIKEYPHELDKIEKVINDARENDQDYVTLEFSEIIKSNIWNADEKARLLNFLGYSKNEHNLEYIDEYQHKDTMKDYKYTIKYNILSGFEALMKIYKNIERHYAGHYLTKDEAYRNVFNAIIDNCKDEDKAVYLKAILDNLTEEDIKRLIAPYYKGQSIDDVCNESIFINIIASKDIDLIKKYMVYIEDINMYLSEAVVTGNVEIVKLFLGRGADINYLTDEVILGRLTPLKTAIANNDYAMVRFLIDNGANIDLHVTDEDFINRLNNYQIDIFSRFKRDRFDRALKIRYLKTANEEDKDVKQLKYIRESSPLEYAIKLSEDKFGHRGFCSSQYDVYFNGRTNIVKNKLEVDKYNISEQVENRGRIVDVIFNGLADKTNINYSDLIGFTFITRDTHRFKKYARYAINNNYQIDFDLLFQLYFALHMQAAEEMVIPFLDLISKYDENSNIYLKLFNYYLEREIKFFNFKRFYISDFNYELLNRIPKEKRKNICLVPYCKSLDSLKYLLSLGFDINQVDDNGRNILYYLLDDDFNKNNIELFNYLLENLDLTMKDNDNKTSLYYAMQRFATKDEYQYAAKDRIRTRSNLETAVAILISKMPKEEVCNDDIKKVLEKRLEFSGAYGEKIHLEYVFQHHKELFDALIDKGFVLSEKILNDIFKSLYSPEEWNKERLLNTVDMENTLDFLYTRLDYNCEVQEIDIEKEFENLMDQMDSQDITLEEFLRSLTNFNNQIISLNLFYENNIKKKFNPEKYLQYAKEKYNTVYTNLDRYLTLIIIKGIRKFGNEKVLDILDAVPNYDINYYVEDEDVGLDYWNDFITRIEDIIDIDEEGNATYGNEYFATRYIYEDHNDKIVFTGNLIQYAILIDDLPLVQLLQTRGAKLKFLLNGYDCTWNYVNSHTMLNYIESVIGKSQFGNLDDEDKYFYINLKISNQQDNDNAADPKTFVLKRDDSKH